MNTKSRPLFAPRYSLRALLVAMLLFGPLTAVGWKDWVRWWEWQERRAMELQQERERAAIALLRKQREDAAREVAKLMGQLGGGTQTSTFLKGHPLWSPNSGEQPEDTDLLRHVQNPDDGTRVVHEDPIPKATDDSAGLIQELSPPTPCGNNQ